MEDRNIKIALIKQVAADNDYVETYEAKLDIHGFTDIEACETLLQAAVTAAQKELKVHTADCQCESSRFCRELILGVERLYKVYTPKSGN